MKALGSSLQFNRLLQKFISSQKLQYATTNTYQFKKDKIIYYPDRRKEMERINETKKSELTEIEQKRNLPKDYYYRVLGLHKHATTQDIKAAYYTLAKRFHPDIANQKNDKMVSKRFQEISHAYHILTDESKRLEYDQLGEIQDEQTFLKKINTKDIGKEYRVKALGVLKGLTRSTVDSAPMQSLNYDGKYQTFVK